MTGWAREQCMTWARDRHTVVENTKQSSRSWASTPPAVTTLTRQNGVPGQDSAASTLPLHPLPKYACTPAGTSHIMKRNRASYEKDNKSEFVVYGTPLPPLDPDVRDDGSYVPIWKQEAMDEGGRKRFHGAFTGGFSAGYFNTVGSKEGWTPATFKSSRTARAKTAQARPEDFMDEEDFAAAAEEAVLETRPNYTGLGSTADELAAKSKLSAMDLFKPPPEETMGIKLLKKMGGKEGQGIGPKIKRKAVLTDEDGADVGMEDQPLHYFAPTNSPLITINKKDDRKGLGYNGLAKDESIRDQQLESKVSVAPSRRGGFGVGVLNDEDEDDEDIYEIKPKSSYNRIIGGDKKKLPKQKGLKAAPGRHVFKSAKANIVKTSLNLRKCFDGRLPLDGFVLATEPMQTKDGWYSPPEIPEGWVPAVSGRISSNISKDVSTESTPESIATKLNPQARGKILGETPLPGKSVFDYLSSSARDKIVAATGRTNLPPALNEAPPLGYPPAKPTDLVPKLDKNVALGALNGGFMPYADDLDKRARYRKFLEISAGLREGLPEKKPGMSNGDWVNELNEFVGCARIFKPASGMISSRFTSSTSAASQIKTGEGVTSTDPDVLIHYPSTAVKEKSPAEHAASIGMYGGLTRTIEEFWPTRLLCKRFNTRPPKHVEAAAKTGNGESGSAGSSNKFDAASFMQQAATGITPEEPMRQAPVRGPKELISKSEIVEMMNEVKGDASYEIPMKDSMAKEKTADVDVERNEALEGVRPADDVFKAIFGDDDNDADEI